MAYMKSSLVSRPVESSFGISEALGVDWGAVAGAGGKVLDFFGSGLKAQGAQEALAAQMKAESDARAAAAARAGGIPTTYLLIGGAAVLGVLALAMRRK